MIEQHFYTCTYREEVKAWKEDKDGQAGYMVSYKAGTYPFWMPAYVFELMFELERTVLIEPVLKF